MGLSVAPSRRTSAVRVDSHRHLAIALAALLAATAIVFAPGRVSHVGASAVQVLYAVTGSGGGADGSGQNYGGSLSSLYTFDPGNANVLTGPTPITISATQIRHVNGIAAHPSSGVLYGVMNGQDTAGNDYGLATLITINPTTGVATVIGTLGTCVNPDYDCYEITDIAFDPFGNLFGWNISSPSNGLVKINLATGDATLVDESQSWYGMGLAISSSAKFYLAGTWSGDLWRVSHATGLMFDNATLGTGSTGQINNVLAFDASDVLYAGKRTSTGFSLYYVGAGNTLNLVGTNAVSKVSAIAFWWGAVTPPASADLSLDKAVNDPTPATGDTITFTLTLTNDGPDAAVGVEVTDALSSVYAYQSQSGDGSYDENTGVWSVGSVLDGETLSIDIVVTVGTTTNLSSYLNSARITADETYDPDSVVDNPQEGISNRPGDIYDEVQPDVYDPDVDAAVSLTITGPTRAGAKTKGFKATVTNVGSVSIFVQSSYLEVTVNDSPTSCKAFAKTLLPGQSVTVRCTYSPANVGFGTGDSVYYVGTVDVPLDGNSGNDEFDEGTTAT